MPSMPFQPPAGPAPFPAKGGGFPPKKGAPAKAATKGKKMPGKGGKRGC